MGQTIWVSLCVYRSANGTMLVMINYMNTIVCCMLYLHYLEDW